MEKISITNLVDFKRKTPKGRQTLVNNLKIPKIKTNDGTGGDYWISALSTISNVFAEDNNSLINEKIDILLDKIENTTAKISKDMFQRNINILYNFEDYDFAKLKPNVDLTYLKKPKEKSILVVKDLPLYVKPHHVFTFTEDEVKKIGALWFVAKLGSFKPDELAIGTDILFRYLHTNYSDKFEIASNYCLAVDVTNLSTVSYMEIQNEEDKSTLLETLAELKQHL